jgi:hypothetical protein
MEGPISERLKRISQIDALVSSLVEERTRIFGEILAAQSRQNQLFQTVPRGVGETKTTPPSYQRGTSRFGANSKSYQGRQPQSQHKVVEMYRSINVGPHN